MSNPAKVSLKVIENNSQIVFFKNGSSDVMTKLINDGDDFKLRRYISDTSSEEDIFTVDEDGKIVFHKNVKFNGGSTIIDSQTLSLEDQKVEIGLSDSYNIKEVSVSSSSTVVDSVSGYIYTFTISSDLDSGTVYNGGDYVYFQNTFISSGTDYTAQTQFQNAIKVLSLSTTPSGSDPTSSQFQVWVAGDSVSLDYSNRPIIVAKLSSLTNNTGIQILANDSGTLIKGKMLYDTDNNNALVIDNNAGKLRLLSSPNDGGIELETGTSGIKLDTTGILSIDSAGGSSNISHTATTGGDFTIEMNGNVDASLILKSTGTAQDALQLTSSVGGMDITSADKLDIITSGNNADIKITPNGSGDLILGSSLNNNLTIDSRSFSIDANGDSSNITLATDGNSENLTIELTGNTDSSLILSSSGTGADALQINTTSGGINITNGGTSDLDMSSTHKSINISAGEGVNDAIKINTTNNAGGIDIDAGTSGIAIDTTGILSIDSAGSASNISHTATTGGDFTIEMNGNVDASLILKSTGTEDNALQITATTGGIDINSSDNITIDSSSGLINIGTDTNNNNINIGTADAGSGRSINMGTPNSTVNIDGTVNATGEINTSSDFRLKNNIEKISNALEKINKMEGVTFKWNNNNSKVNIGFIAQEIQKIEPNLVRTGENGYLVLNYNGIIPILVEALKEQQKQINSLL